MRIAFAGEGWGAIPAVKSLQAYFAELEIISPDPAIHALMRTADRLVPSFEHVTSQTIVCANYKPLISDAQLKAHEFVNIHYSLLPLYRGMHPVIWGILNGEKELGFSIHLMNKDVDDGPILAQYRVNYQGQTSTEIMHHFNEQVGVMLGKVMHEYLNGTRTPTIQDKTMATWVPKRNHDDCRINFNSTCEELERFFKALVPPYPLPHITVKDTVIEISKGTIISRNYKCTNGRVVNIDDEGVWIKIEDGLLLIQEIIHNSITAAPASVFKRGQRLS